MASLGKNIGLLLFHILFRGFNNFKTTMYVLMFQQIKFPLDNVANAVSCHPALWQAS